MYNVQLRPLCPLENLWDALTLRGPGNDYLDKEEVGYTCGGWAALAQHALQEKVEGSECWTFASEMGGHIPILDIPTHMWASLQIMDFEKIHLDPWPSGGVSY